MARTFGTIALIGAIFSLPLIIGLTAATASRTSGVPAYSTDETAGGYSGPEDLWSD